MDEQETAIRIGARVRVLSPDAILSTLDEKGALDGLPFMPEMIPYCGRCFTVARRVEKTCVACAIGNGGRQTQIRGFSGSDVFFLEGLRCSGAAHDGCGRACMLFWKSRWIEPILNEYEDRPVPTQEAERLHSRLKTCARDLIYFCQSTELGTATDQMSVPERVLKLLHEVIGGRVSIGAAMEALLAPIWRRLSVSGRSRSTRKATPQEALSLEPGDVVEVKSYSDILRTLDGRGANRGLLFVDDMRRFCGNRLRVRSRVERMILEDSGRIVNTKNTVVLDGATCSYSRRFAGCPRQEFHYWREIWLKRARE